MILKTQSAIDYTLPQLAELANRAFTNYIGGEFRFKLASFAGFLAREGIDLNLSQVVLGEEDAVGLALIARQGWSSRLAMMGIVPEAKGQGIGTWFLERLIKAARLRQDQSLALEVIEQNTPGVKLYSGFGFETIRRLWGYTAPDFAFQALEQQSDTKLEEIDVFEVAKIVMQYGAADLPWQVSGTTLARMSPPYCGYRRGPAYAVISDPQQKTVSFRSLIVDPHAARQGCGTQLIKALIATYAHKTWTVPAICPEGSATQLFEKLGFERQAINQLQMKLDLSSKI